MASRSDPPWVGLMEQAAKAAGAGTGPFMVGVRPHNGTWFANFNGVEYDGHPKHSVPDVIEAMRRTLEAEVSAAERGIKASRGVLDALPARGGVEG